MNEQAIKEERERSARKQAEIDAEVNNNKEIVYNYIASRKDVVGAECVKELGFFDKGKRYLEWLTLHGHLVRMKRTVGGRRHYVYNVATPYIKPICEIDTTKPTDTQIAIESVTRVFNLLDRPQVPRHKSERVKKSGRSMSTMQSSMNMFGSW
jgi:hypothetical protein